MTLEEVLAELESLGTEQNRKIYRRHGGTEPILGVSFANLYSLRRRIKRDQPLAVALWETRISEAQFLATMIADPQAFSRKDLDRWASTATSYAIADFVAKEIAVRTPFAMDAARKWIDAKSEVVGRAGWATVGCLAISGGAPDDFFLSLLPRLERDIHTAPNRIRESMNSAMISIGSRNEVLRVAATEAARRIGKVYIDHGETYCKTPDAVTYIEKTFARKAARAGV
jgi:3-methyladenine DNA glycosylase AlkD